MVWPAEPGAVWVIVVACHVLDAARRGVAGRGEAAASTGAAAGPTGEGAGAPAVAGLRVRALEDCRDVGSTEEGGAS